CRRVGPAMELSATASYRAAVPPRAACVYSSCYCEENVWKLCEYIRSQDRHPVEDFYAVFISNDRRMVSGLRSECAGGCEMWLL
uniref:Protein N-terminal glutamine amidohydrolase n=1 Tax=Coturnix japonica TaxID=93934 RepID=A0A8C2T1U1_COTJA